MDRKFWIETGIAFAMLVVMSAQVYLQVYPPNPVVASQTQGTLMAPIDWMRFLPLGVMTGLVIANTLLLYKQRRGIKGPFVKGLLLKSTGTAANATTHTINLSALQYFKADFKVAVVCGITDDAADKIDDTRITTSAAFTITNDDREVKIPHDGELGIALAAYIESHRPPTAIATPGFRQPPKRKRGILTITRVQTQTWTEVILLPKGTDPKLIKRLSDVPKLQGLILSHEIEEGRITRTW